MLLGGGGGGGGGRAMQTMHRFILIGTIWVGAVEKDSFQ